MKNKIVPKLRFPEFRDAEEWKETTLNNLGELVSGLIYTPDDIRDKGLLVLRSSNVQNNEITLEDCIYVTPDIKGANISEPNDILICVRNGSKSLIGTNALIPSGMPLCTHGSYMSVFRSKSAKFIFRLFQTESYNRQVSADLVYPTNFIDTNRLKKYRFYVPDSSEQQKIVDCISSVDELITAQSQKLDAIKAYKKGLMQQLFPAEGETTPNFRFPEFRDAGEWEKTKLCLLDKSITQNYFFEHYFKSTYWRRHATDLMDMLVPCPYLDEQQKIADCLSSIDELITAQSQKLEALKAHKKGLIQQLFPNMDDR